MSKYKKIAVIDNEIEAQILENILIEQNIFYVIRSYYDEAYGGLFQFQKGWGEVYGSEEDEQVIKKILQAIRQGDQSS